MESANTRGAVRAPPALNPEQLAIVQPWKDFISRGVVTEISVSFTPGGTNVKVTLAETVPVPNGTERKNLPPGLAKQLVLDSNLVPVKGKGKGKGPKVENLPARSLCAADLENPSSLEKRMEAVASKLGSSTALGRIGSMKINLYGATTFEQWWSAANEADKASLVMDNKHLKACTAQQVLVLNQFLKGSKSPFRGSLPTESINDKEEEEPKKEAKVPAGKARAPTPPKKK